jgi:hypothetical protein
MDRAQLPLKPQPFPSRLITLDQSFLPSQENSSLLQPPKSLPIGLVVRYHGTTVTVRRLWSISFMIGLRLTEAATQSTCIRQIVVARLPTIRTVLVDRTASVTLITTRQPSRSELSWRRRLSPTSTTVISRSVVCSAASVCSKATVAVAAEQEGVTNALA